MFHVKHAGIYNRVNVMRQCPYCIIYQKLMKMFHVKQTEKFLLGEKLC